MADLKEKLGTHAVMQQPATNMPLQRLQPTKERVVGRTGHESMSFPGGLESCRRTLHEAETFYGHTLVLRAVALDAAKALDNLEVGLQRFAAPNDGPLASTPHMYIPVPEDVQLPQPASGPATLLPVEVVLEPEVGSLLSSVAPLETNAASPQPPAQPVAGSRPDDVLSTRGIGVPGQHGTHHAQQPLRGHAVIIRHLVEPMELYQAVLNAAKARLKWLEKRQAATPGGVMHALGANLLSDDQHHAESGFKSIVSLVHANVARLQDAASAAEPAGPGDAMDEEPGQQEVLLEAALRWLVSSAPRLRALAAHCLNQLRKHADAHTTPEGLLEPLPPQLLILPASARTEGLLSSNAPAPASQSTAADMGITDVGSAALLAGASKPEVGDEKQPPKLDQSMLSKQSGGAVAVPAVQPTQVAAVTTAPMVAGSSQQQPLQAVTISARVLPSTPAVPNPGTHAQAPAHHRRSSGTSNLPVTPSGVSTMAPMMGSATSVTRPEDEAVDEGTVTSHAGAEHHTLGNRAGILPQDSATRREIAQPPPAMVDAHAHHRDHHRLLKRNHGGMPPGAAAGGTETHLVGLVKLPVKDAA